MKKSILYPLVYLIIAILGMIWNAVIVRRIILTLVEEGGTYGTIQQALMAGGVLSMAGALALTVFTILVIAPLAPRYRSLMRMMVARLIAVIGTWLLLLVAVRIENVALIWMIVVMRAGLELLPIGLGVMVLTDPDLDATMRGAFMVHLVATGISVLLNGTIGQVLFQGGLLIGAPVGVRSVVLAILGAIGTLSFVVVLNAIFKQEEHYQDMERTVPLVDLD